MTRAVDTFVQLYATADEMPDVFEFLARQPGLNARERLEILLVDQHHRWKSQQAIPLGHYFDRVPEVADELKVDLIIEEFGYLEQRGVAPKPDEFVSRYDSLSVPALNRLCDALDVESVTLIENGASTFKIKSVQLETPVPEKIGRYETVREIGAGSFGQVFLARDPDLERLVAIKIPTSRRVAMGGGPIEFLNEARAVAKLDHPNIVPVYDCGQLDDGRCFVVSKYVKGKELRAVIRNGSTVEAAVAVVATLARALHSAHRLGIVHRDVKPGNIIVDREQRPHLLDFGLALQEYESHESDGILVGTPAYMSPEQAEGFVGSIDGRSDIYSLGLILYEMLAGRLPIQATTANQVLAQRAHGEIRPLRQIDDSLPRELEQICMRALARQVTDRYPTAMDFAVDLEQFLSVEFSERVSNDSDGLTDRKQNNIGSSTRNGRLYAIAVLTMITMFAFYTYRNRNVTESKNAVSDLVVDSQLLAPKKLALIGFRNVTGDNDLNWLSTGLSHLLFSELKKHEDLKLAPLDHVLSLKSDMDLSNVESLGSSALKKVKDRLGVNWIVSGSYSPAGAELDQIRFELNIQNVSSSKIFATSSQAVPLDDWFHWVTDACGLIRKDLKLSRLDLMKTGQLTFTGPVSIDVASEFYRGLDEQVQGDVSKGLESLLKAADKDPMSAVIQDEIATTYMEMGDLREAVKYAQRAVELTPGLPVNLQLEIAGRHQLISGRPASAVAIYREWYEASQRSIQSGVELAKAMIKAGQGRQALRLLRDLIDRQQPAFQRAEIQIVASDAAQSISDFESQLEFAQQAEQQAKASFSNLLFGESLLRQGHAILRLGESRKANDKLNHACELFRSIHHQANRVRSLAAISKAFVDQGDLPNAERRLVEAESQSISLTNRGLANQLVGQRGELLIYQGQFEEATKKLTESRDQFLELGDAQGAAGMNLTLANVVARRGDFETARELILSARKAFQETSNRQSEARTWGQQGAIYGRAGDSDKAREHFERALELFREVGDQLGEATCLGDLASTYSSVGKLKTAADYFSQSLDIHRQIASRRGPSTVMFNLALLYIRTGRTKEALTLLKDSLSSFEKRGNQMNACFVSRKLGDLQLQLGDLDDAEQTLNSTLTQATKIGAKSVQAQALASLAELHLHRDDIDQAASKQRESREIRVTLQQEGNIALNNIALAKIALHQGDVGHAQKLIDDAELPLALNRQGWEWIRLAVEIQIVSEVQDELARILLLELETEVAVETSEDIYMRLAIDHEHALALVAVGEFERAIEKFEIVILRARKQNLTLKEMQAMVDLMGVRIDAGVSIDSGQIDDLYRLAMSKGLTFIGKQFEAIRSALESE